MKLKIIAIFSFLLIQNLALYSLAKDNRSAEKLYNLCSKFPLNSQCKEYKVPIPLSQRPGIKAQCLMPEAEKAKLCSVFVNTEKFSAYTEVGESLSILGDKRDTKEMILPIQSISYLGYSESSTINVGAVIAVGIWGLLAPEKRSQIRIVAQQQDKSQQILIVSSRKDGKKLRQDLETVTAKKAFIESSK